MILRFSGLYSRYAFGAILVLQQRGWSISGGGSCKFSEHLWNGWTCRMVACHFTSSCEDSPDSYHDWLHHISITQNQMSATFNVKKCEQITNHHQVFHPSSQNVAQKKPNGPLLKHPNHRCVVSANNFPSAMPTLNGQGHGWPFFLRWKPRGGRGKKGDWFNDRFKGLTPIED